MLLASPPSDMRIGKMIPFQPIRRKSAQRAARTQKTERCVREDLSASLKFALSRPGSQTNGQVV